ncbi:dihydrofolate reductase family protein [Pseudalkalibacillus salsuginis]|uniref:dihydrofolate reductase family protein n=1 Tax=Pseudalkalibacillus salsuginis TaxID=2910972 RepID=UPI001F3556B2|nr:dihydrofolate reductase family protein [Pseudalkalibacillus salsuginis]MCF6411734.1 dihydrofolate reductase family protein [Pseudalkalibacillus salsuginis]
MGKIIVSVHSTLDGVFTGPRGDENNMTSWAMPGVTDSMKDILTMVQQAEAILIGRVTYEGLSQVWPFQEGDFADAMNNTPKYVATRNINIQEVHWGNYSSTISLLAGDLSQNVAKLKNLIQGDILVTSSARLVQSLINAGLADEISIVIHPVILGSGERYLDNITARTDLKLLNTQLYENSGAMRLDYEIIK